MVVSSLWNPEPPWVFSFKNVPDLQVGRHFSFVSVHDWCNLCDCDPSPPPPPTHTHSHTCNSSFWKKHINFSMFRMIWGWTRALGGRGGGKLYHVHAVSKSLLYSWSEHTAVYIRFIAGHFTMFTYRVYGHKTWYRGSTMSGDRTFFFAIYTAICSACPIHGVGICWPYHHYDSCHLNINLYVRLLNSRMLIHNTWIDYRVYHIAVVVTQTC